MNHGLTSVGLAIVCETCESDIDFPDDYADVGVCRQCGVAFLVDAPSAGLYERSGSAGRVGA
jgi:hypothetical protein